MIKEIKWQIILMGIKASSRPSQDPIDSNFRMLLALAKNFRILKNWLFRGAKCIDLVLLKKTQ